MIDAEDFEVYSEAVQFTRNAIVPYGVYGIEQLETAYDFFILDGWHSAKDAINWRVQQGDTFEEAINYLNTTSPDDYETDRNDSY